MTRAAVASSCRRTLGRGWRLATALRFDRGDATRDILFLCFRDELLHTSFFVRRECASAIGRASRRRNISRYFADF